MKRKKIDLSNVNEKKQAVLMNAEQLLHMAQTDKQVKTVSTEYKFDNQSVIVNDISLRSRGPMEDGIFASDINLHHNVRRGLSVITFQNQKSIICRRGLKKFFDVQYDELYPGAQVDDQQSRILRSYTFKDVEQAFMKEGGSKIQILKLEKANGENAQISYIKGLDSWVMCSKNVSLLARSSKELDNPMFTEQRFNFSLIIAKAWFKQIESLDPAQVSLLKDILQNNTLIGEYCGNPAYQHLVYYADVHIRFYAMVNHSAEETCVDPELAYSIFEKFNLRKVAINKIEADTAVDFFHKLRNMFKEVSTKTVEEEGEGAVIYFYDGSKILSLAKLKTLEYRVLRKLREKLKTLLLSQEVKDSAKTLLIKFSKECQQLQSHVKTIKPQEYYNEIATQSMKFLSDFMIKNKGDAQKISNIKKMVASQFIDFITVFRKAVDKNLTVQQNQFDLALTQIDKVVINESDEEEQKSQPQVYSVKNTKITKTIYLFVPLTVPASGKSYFINEQQKRFSQNYEESKDQGLHSKIDIFTVSSDQIRKLIINEFMNLNNIVSHQEAYDQSNEDYNQAYLQDFKNVIQKAQDSNKNQVIVFLDENYPPYAVEKPIKLFKDFFWSKPEVKVVTIGLIPSTSMAYGSYPFSLTYLLTCIKRAISRDNHDTLKGSKAKIASVVLKFFIFFKKQQNFDKYFDKIIKFPFTAEFDLSEEISKFFDKFIPLCESTKNSDEIVHKYSDELNQCIKYAEACDWGYPAQHEYTLDIIKH